MPKKAIIVQSAPKRSRRRRVRRRGGRPRAASIAAQLTSAYFRSLVDPFEHRGVRLGWGCFTPTTIISAVWRTTITSNTDGSLALMLLPGTANALLYWNSGAGSATSGNVNAGNVIAINGACAEGRVISLGLRAFPGIPLTSTPGAVYTGAIPAVNYTQVGAFYPTGFAGLTTSHQYIGVRGASATGRPVDPDSFIFMPQVVANSGNSWTAAGNASVDFPMSLPYISFLGLPGASVVYIEAVVNIEATPAVAAVGLVSDDSAAEPTLADTWPSFESMWGKIKEYLPNPGRGGEDAAVYDDTWMTSVLSGLRSAGSAMRSMTNLGSLLTSPYQYLTGGSNSSYSGQRYPSVLFGN